MESTNEFDLQRFATAQQPVYTSVLDELRSGQKQSHWMWFVFPQVEGLGHSAMAQKYAIKSRDEAIAYIATPLLGARLIESTRLVLAISKKTATQIFGTPDDAKFKSCMTLFDAVDRGGLYGQALDRFFAGERDQPTLDVLARWSK